jgi:hypothetical protein
MIRLAHDAVCGKAEQGEECAMMATIECGRE